MKRNTKRFSFLMLIMAFVFAFAGTFILAESTNGKINLEKTATKIYTGASENNLEEGRYAKVDLTVGGNDYTVTNPGQPLDIVLVMDGSVSMEGQRIRDAKNAAIDFTNTLVDGQNSNVRIGIVEYATRVKDVLDFSSEKQKIINFINNSYSVNGGNEGGTNLQSGIARATQMLATARTDAKKVVIILTDGVPTFFYYNNDIYGTGNSNSKVCVEGSRYRCTKEMAPSEAAKTELDGLKNNNKNSDVYTITFGNEPEAASILKQVNPENQEPLYKNYTALTGNDLKDMFDLISESINRVIGKNAVVTDIIPASFKLTKESKDSLISKGITVTENEDGTTTLVWNVNEISSEVNKSISYEVRAEDDYHGSMYTNKSAVLQVEVDASNPFYDGKTKLSLEFEDPTVEIPAITNDDSYTTNSSYVGYENQKIEGTSILTNDKLTNKLTDSENSSIVSVSDSIKIIENPNVVKKLDGSFLIYKDSKLQGTLEVNTNGTFTFTPEDDITGEVTFDYQIVSRINPYQETEFVYSNISKVTLNILPKAKTTINGEKTWIDNNNQDGLRPNSIEVGLYANGELISSKTVTSSDNWKYTFKDLTVYEKGFENDRNHMIKYEIKELSKIEGYKTSYKDANIINTHEVEKTSINGEKVWDDNNNQDGLRPDSITIDLYANGTFVKSTTATKDSNWKYSFTDLDKNKDGKEIEYTVSEKTVANYRVSYDKFVITNTHAPIKIDINGEKKWVDSDDKDGLRPDSVTIDLFANGEYVKSKLASKNGNWNYSFTNLDKYANGEEIEYTVKEVAVDNYTSSYDDENPFIIVNTHNPRDIEVSGTKTWVDTDNIYGRPDSITVNLYADGEYVKSVTTNEENNWNYSFTGLPEYKNGNIINYTITENAVKDYDTTYNGFNITNTYNPETIDISGTKTWDDADNQDGKRPDEITVNLLANGQIVERAVVTSDDEGNWNFEFKDLVKYANGEEIEYTLEEVSVDGYETVIEDFNITNTHTPEKVSFKVQKTWDDFDNNDGIRPESITVNLLANGIVVATEEITANNGWTYTFENFDKYANGTAIEYTVEEDAVKGYTPTINKVTADTTEETSFDIVNTHEKETIDITVNKIWNDFENMYKTRPESITVRLYGNDILIDTAVITADMNWMYTFKGLFKYELGKLITYTLVEDEVMGYETSYDGTTIINTYIKKEEPNKVKPKSKKVNSEIIPPYTGEESSNEILIIIIGSLSIIGFIPARRYLFD